MTDINSMYLLYKGKKLLWTYFQVLKTNLNFLPFVFVFPLWKLHAGLNVLTKSSKLSLSKLVFCLVLALMGCFFAGWLGSFSLYGRNMVTGEVLQMNCASWQTLAGSVSGLKIFGWPLCSLWVHSGKNTLAFTILCFLLLTIHNYTINNCKPVLDIGGTSSAHCF